MKIFIIKLLCIPVILIIGSFFSVFAFLYFVSCNIVSLYKATENDFKNTSIKNIWNNIKSLFHGFVNL